MPHALARDHDVALAPVAADAQHDRRSLRAADHADGALLPEASDWRAVDGEDLVARHEAGIRGASAGNDIDDREPFGARFQHGADAGIRLRIEDGSLERAGSKVASATDLDALGELDRRRGQLRSRRGSRTLGRKRRGRRCCCRDGRRRGRRPSPPRPMPHPLQNRPWVFFFPGAFLRQLTPACRSRRVPFVAIEEAARSGPPPKGAGR